MYDIHRASLVPADHISLTRVMCGIVEGSSRHIWSRIAPADVHFARASSMRRQMSVCHGPGTPMKFGVTKSLNRYRDLSIRVGKFGWGTHGGGDNVHDPIIHKQLSRFVHVAQRWSSAGAKHDHSRAPSARSSSGDFYVGFTGPGVKTDCVPTESGPSGFDWVWYLVWSSADASGMCVGPICLTFGTTS